MLAGLLSGCAARQVSLPPVGPSSDPARVADGFRVTPVESAVARVRLTANGVTTSQTIPADVPHFITFCDPGKTWSSARWFLIRIDLVDQANAGPVSVESPDCYKTPTGYAFAAGSHQVDVILDNHCEAGATEPICLDSNQQPPTSTVDTYGLPSTVQVLASGAQLVGPPPSIVNGQVVR